MNNKVDFFQKKLANTRSFSRQRDGARIWIWIVVIIVFLVLGLVTWKLFFAPVNLDELKENQSLNFSLGEEIYLQGEIKIEGNPAIYSYTIDDVDFGKFGLRANDNIVLSNYVGFVQLTGIVEKIYQETPIVRVLTLSGTLAGSGDDTNIVLDGNAGVYLKGAGVQFLPSFFDEYVLLNEGENGEIRIQNIETGKEIVLKYFRCNPSDPNRNCKGLSETFENNNAQTFVTSEHDHYYKQSEVQSWFVANGNRWGIFIDNVPDDEVYKLKDLIKFANEDNMNEWIKSRAMKICQGEGEKLQKINNSEINLKQEGLIVTVSGDGMEKQMTCQILVDFSLPAKGELQSLIIGDDVVISEELEVNEETKTEEVSQEEKKDGGQISAAPFDTNVPQFPLKGEEKKYESIRGGYVLTFPSSNISFVVSSVKENFGRSDVSCSHVINVIKYTEKDNLEVSPSIRIYECLGTATQSWAPEIIVYPRLDKLFVVQMNDGAWHDFAMNLKFDELAEE